MDMRFPRRQKVGETGTLDRQWIPLGRSANSTLAIRIKVLTGTFCLRGLSAQCS